MYGVKTTTSHENFDVRALLESVEFRALFYRAELAHLVKILILSPHSAPFVPAP